MSEASRHATLADLPIVLQIAEQHAATLPDKRGGAMLLADDSLEGTLEDRLRAALDDPEQLVIAGTFDDVVFGLGSARIVRYDDGRAVARLSEFVVDPEARSVGIGEAMMNQAVEWATSQGCVGIDSRALPGDRETKNFFESFGLKARLLTVHRAFD